MDIIQSSYGAMIVHLGVGTLKPASSRLSEPSTPAMSYQLLAVLVVILAVACAGQVVGVGAPTAADEDMIRYALDHECGICIGTMGAYMSTTASSSLLEACQTKYSEALCLASHFPADFAVSLRRSTSERTCARRAVASVDVPRAVAAACCPMGPSKPAASTSA